MLYNGSITHARTHTHTSLELLNCNKIVVYTLVECVFVHPLRTLKKHGRRTIVPGLRNHASVCMCV